MEEDGDAPAHDAVDGGAVHGVAARLQAEPRRGCSRGRGCSPLACAAPPRQKKSEKEARNKEKTAWEGAIGRIDGVRIFTHGRGRFDNC